MKKFVAIILTVILLINFTGCNFNNQNSTNNYNFNTSNSTSSSENNQKIDNISIPIDLKDSLNPYLAKTSTNLNLMPLIFDSLVTLNDKYVPENIIAQSIENNGNSIKITIKSNITFSDGSILTSNDIKYSYDEIIKNNSYYSKRLYNVSKVTVISPTQILFELIKPDIFFVNNLDFPIVKSNTASYDIPIGSGKYIVKKIDDSLKLELNTNYYTQITANFNTINLNSFPDLESMILGIKTNQITAMFSDLSSGEISTTNTLTQNVPINNMLYLGFNGEKGVLNQQPVRQAISYSIDKQSILSKAFSSKATTTNIPCNPNFNIDNNITSDNMITYNLEKANDILDKSGFSSKDTEGFRLDSSNNRITINILVNKDNIRKKNMASIIKDMLKLIGFNTNLVEVPYNEYIQKIAQLDFDIYIGEIKLLNNMDISGFFNGSQYSAGISNQKLLLDNYNLFTSGQLDYCSFLKIFNDQAPFLPIGFISGLIIYNKNIQKNVSPTPSNIYNNINSWL